MGRALNNGIVWSVKINCRIGEITASELRASDCKNTAIAVPNENA